VFIVKRATVSDRDGGVSEWMGVWQEWVDDGRERGRKD
jgi:hypothetical protein